ncbi:BTB/POZ and MATH domain-containing protein 1-like [Aegilops tauschii subsp. strangulata]|uniref:BTB/POZ and MATH domain-containing protein 1-like n=1 Tax=Triticum aestivum TaxID=4565 RepID=UPI000989D55E|nr:BTB/POZ and MATH domain-containing protein 1-like [Triticum aestivum]
MAASLIPDPVISTTSTCAPERTRGEHVFKIEGYSVCKGFGVGKFIRSATFSVGGHDWCVRYYPDGVTEAYRDYVSVYLELMNRDVEVLALCHLTLVQQATGSPAQFASPKLMAPVLLSSSIGSITWSWGYATFATRSDLEASSHWYIPDDVLLIKCELTVIKPKVAQMSMTTRNFHIQVPPSDLSDNLRSLLEEGEGSDVSFKVKDEVFTAHKIVLAMRSPVFKAELYGPMRDKFEQSITIKDMEPAVFKALLRFIYSDELPPMDDLNDDDKQEMVKHLLVATDRYGVERMKLMCERKLCKFLEANNVATTLALADQHHCSKLKDACIGFINSLDRVDDVMTSTGYQHLKRACPSVFVGMWEKAAKIRKLQ